jgi:hypothetical protein
MKWLLTGLLAAIAFGAQAEGTRYEAEYPTIRYSEAPTHNAIAQLQDRLTRGEVRLEFRAPRGYLDSVLSALGIDPSSQTLVYSKTSLQLQLIQGSTPRAIYFDDDTYIAWIPGTRFLEIVTMDAVMGPVFYALSNTSPDELHIDRESSRCLTCHDTWGMTGGGVPTLLFLSTLVDRNGESLTGQPGASTSDRTPIAERWAGWYVTGQPTKQLHLGNILVDPDADMSDPARLAPGTLDNVKALFDSSPYRTDKSDIVALLVFEHQAHVGNLITRANYKSRTLLEKNGLDVSKRWADVPEPVQKQLKAMFEPLVQALLFVNAAPVTGEMRSNSGFDRWFESKGPKDTAGRSLRELDLRTRVFRHPLSYLIYSQSFDGLPLFAQEYVYRRISDVLDGRDQSAGYAHISADERRTLREILVATKPAYTRLTPRAGGDP